MNASYGPRGELEEALRIADPQEKVRRLDELIRRGVLSIDAKGAVAYSAAQ